MNTTTRIMSMMVSIPCFKPFPSCRRQKVPRKRAARRRLVEILTIVQRHIRRLHQLLQPQRLATIHLPIFPCIQATIHHHPCQGKCLLLLVTTARVVVSTTTTNWPRRKSMRWQWLLQPRRQPGILLLPTLDPFRHPIQLLACHRQPSRAQLVDQRVEVAVASAALVNAFRVPKRASLMILQACPWEEEAWA